MKTNKSNKTNNVLTREQTATIMRVINGEVRSFSSYHNYVVKLWDACHIDDLYAIVEDCKRAVLDARGKVDNAEMDALKKSKLNADKRHADALALRATDCAELRTAIDALRAKLPRVGFTDLNLQFLKTWLPLNTHNQICDIKVVDLADEAECIALYPQDNAKGYDLIRDNDSGKLRLFKPVQVWTAQKYLAKFNAAATLRDKSARETSALEREREKAENARKRYEAMRKQCDEYERANGINHDTESANAETNAA